MIWMRQWALQNFEYKKDKATTQILNFKYKTIENKNISFITSNDFHSLCLFVFVMPTSKRGIIVFLFLSKISVLVHYFFKNLYALISLFRIQTFISLVIHFPFKWPRQEAKTKQQQNEMTFTATRKRVC